LLSLWAQQAQEADPRSERGETLEEEVRRLRRENAVLREERAFAKKAAAFFAMESR
jgi:transposase